MDKKIHRLIEYFRSTALYEFIINSRDFLKSHKDFMSIVIIVIFAVGIATYPIVDRMFNATVTKNDDIIYEDITVNKIFVTVAGEVSNPDMYEMTTDNRVKDAIIKAGGFTDNAYTDNINLAQKLEDGQYIYVLSKEQGKLNQQEYITGQENSFNGIVNINNATKNELCKLPGIGEKTAEKIIEYRKKNNGFNSIEELKEIEGIGDSKFNKIKFNITI